MPPKETRAMVEGADKKTQDPEEEEEDEDDDEEWGLQEMVGYLEEPPSKEEAKLLTRRMFPSKVGGKPAWLVPNKLPDLVCTTCERPLRFLLQVYASRGWENPDAFHRAVHLFVCTSCQPNTMRAFRAQLPRENGFYSSEPPDQDRILAEANSDPELEALICWDCGLPCPPLSEDMDDVEDAVSNRCAECDRRLRNKDGPALLPERELRNEEADLPDEDEDAAEEEGGDAEEEAPPEKAVAEADAAVAAAGVAGSAAEVELLERLHDYKARLSKDPNVALDKSEQKVFEEYSKEKGEKDEIFSKFQRFSAENQGHVLRHCFGGEPLWFCSPGRLGQESAEDSVAKSGDDVPPMGPPPCPRCGAARVFEMQVQPQLITLLGDSGSELARRLDYGTACVFVCGASCTAPVDGSPYLEEFVHVQAEPRESWLPRA